MPSITSITPSTFDAGRSVTLDGSGFGASQGSVLIGGVAQNVNTWSDTSITFTTVRGSQSLGACRVDVVGGVGASLPSLLYYEDFSGGTNGASATTVSDWIAVTGIGVIDNDPESGSRKCIRDDFVTTQTGDCGGYYDVSNHTLGADLPRYSEIWFATKVFMPVGFSYYANPYLKFHRFKVESASNAPLGYCDFYLRNAEAANPWHFVVEHGTPNTRVEFGNGSTDRPIRGEWVTYESHVVFDTVPVDSGGSARSDFWINGRHIGSITSRQTLANVTDKCTAVLFSTFWNGGAPANQSWYWADTVIAVKVPSGRDDTPYMVTDNGGRVCIGNY